MTPELKFFLIGLIVGWLIKAPFLIKYYKKIKKDKESMERIYENIKEINRQQQEVSNA